MRMQRITGLAAGLALTSSVLLAGTASAQDRGGDDDEVRRTGSCTAGTAWKLKAKSDDGRLEVEGEVDSNTRGQTWRWAIRHNGSVSARGVGVTAGRSGSFDVERRVADLPGTDTLVFRASNQASGESCRGTLSW